MANNITLTDLNSDCLLKIFEYCDLEMLSSLADVCEILRTIIRSEIFPKFRQFECGFYGRVHVKKPMKLISNIGQYLQKLTICIACDLDQENYIPFFKYIVSWIGHDIRELIITSPVLPADLIAVLRPVFSRLESLKVCCENNDFDYNIDFCSMCPNLLHLQMQGDMSFLPNAEPWPKLESLALGDNEFICNETIERFLANNPQVKRLKVSTFNADVLIEEVVESLPGLEQWVIFQDNSDLLASNAILLQKLKQLNDLKILRIYSDEFNGIVKALGKCAKLRHLKIQAYSEGYEESLFKPDQQNILSVAGELQELETLDISCCKLTESFVIDLIKFARADLKELHLHNCEVCLTGHFIRRIAQVISLRTSGNDVQALKICAPEHLFEDIDAVRAVIRRRRTESDRSIEEMNIEHKTRKLSFFRYSASLMFDVLSSPSDAINRMKINECSTAKRGHK